MFVPPQPLCEPPEANVKDNGFPWPPPGLLTVGILRKTQFLRYYSMREAN